MRARLARAAALALAALALGAVAAPAETVQRGGLRVAFEGKLSPHRLPRTGSAPVSVTLGGRVTSTHHGTPPPLRRIEIALNRQGHLDYAGLPACRLEEIQPATTVNAMRACGAAKVGEGKFSANVLIPQQSPFPSRGEVVVFNGTEDGRPVMLAHVYGTEPVPTSYTLVLRIGRGKGEFATVLTSTLPEVTASVASVTGISLTLGRRYRYRGRVHSYISAGCPAPRGFPGVSFPLAKASFGFGGAALSKVLTRSCKAR